MEHQWRSNMEHPNQNKGVRMRLSEIKINPKNPRIIKDEKFNRLKKSIKEFPKMMELRPMVIDNDNMVLGGNMRLKALEDLKYDDIPDNWIKKASELSEEEIRKFIILDNASFGEWDWDELANEYEVEELKDWGVEVPAFFGQNEAVEDDYEIPDEVLTEIIKGDLFEIGRHRILCGDSRNSNEIAILMKSQLADIVVTDPPYNTGMKANKDAKAWLSQMFDDSFTPEEFEDLLTQSFSNIKQYSKGECAIYIFIDWRNSAQIKFHLEQISDVKNIIVWDKQVHGLGSDYKSTYELIVVGKKGKPEINNRIGLDYQDIWRVQRKMGRDEHHATKKPIELLTKPISHASKEDDIVLDLFGGSGSTMVAAHQLKRSAFLCELKPIYIQITIDRMLKLDPTLEVKKNGQPYQLTGNEQVINAES